MSEAADIELRVAAYCRRRQLERLGPLGSGMHGNVFRAGSSASAGEVALKVHLRREPFELELETYLRLREASVTQPFVLDFAEVRLDFPLEFPDDVWTHWLEEKQEQFGKRWPMVQRVLGEFEAMDIYLLDVSPRNIAFRD